MTKRLKAAGMDDLIQVKQELSGRGVDVNASDQAFRHWLCRGVRIGNIDGNLVSVLFKAFAL